MTLLDLQSPDFLPEQVEDIAYRPDLVSLRIPEHQDIETVRSTGHSALAETVERPRWRSTHRDVVPSPPNTSLASVMMSLEKN